MGAYENPQAVIDTGTPQILANTIIDIGKKAAQAVDTELKNQRDWLTYTYKFSSEEYDKVAAQMEKNNIATEKGFELLKPMLDNSIKLQIDAAKTRDPEEQAQLLKQAQLDKTRIKDFIVTEKGIQEADKDYAAALGGNPGLVGKGGGIPIAGIKDKKYNYAMAIRGTFNEGSQEQVWEGDPPRLVIKFTSDAIAADPNIEGDTIVWDKAELAAYELGTLTDITTNQINALRPLTDKNPKGLGILDAQGKLEKNYYDSENILRKETAKGKDGVWYETPVYPINPNAEAEYKVILDAQAKSLLANPSQAQKDWENQLGYGQGDLKYGSDSGNNNIFDAASNKAFIEAYTNRGLEQLPKERRGEPVRMTTPPPPPEKPPKDATEAQVKRKDIQEDVDKAYEALFVDKIFESDYTDEAGNTAKLKSATINSMGESGFAEQLQKLGLKVKKTEVAGEGDEKVTRYTIESSKIPAFAEQIRSDETLGEVATKLYSATGLNYQGIIDPATRKKFNKLQ